MCESVVCVCVGVCVGGVFAAFQRFVYTIEAPLYYIL